MKINLNTTLIAAGICALTAITRADDATPRQMTGMDTNNMGMDANSMNMPLTPQSFAWQAAATDLKEIHAGEMALQKSDNADVKHFANRLISDHKKSYKKLQAIAGKEGLSLPDTNSMSMMGMNGGDTNSWNPAGTNSGNFQSPPMENQDKDSPPHLATMLASNNMDNMQNNGQMAGQEMMTLDSLSGADFDRTFASHMIMGHEKAIRKFEDASANLTDPDLKKYADKTLPTLREHLQMAQELQSKVGMWTDSNMTNSMPRSQ
jgi:predicted outer membrane protein